MPSLLALLLALLPVAAQAQFGSPMMMSGRRTSAAVPVTITGVSISPPSPSFTPPGATGTTIGTLSATVSSGSPNVTWALSTSADLCNPTNGANNSNFQIVGAVVQILTNNLGVGTYQGCAAASGPYSNTPKAVAFTVTGSSLAAGFFVATNGTNNGTCSITQPCTLYAAQTAMRNSSTKLTYVRAGTYSGLSANDGYGCAGGSSYMICLSGADNGEVWQYYPSDGPCSAIFDGGANAPHSGIEIGWAVTGANITVNGLRIQNVNDPHIYLTGNNNTIENSCLYQNYSYIGAPIFGYGTGNKIYHNDIRHALGAAINLEGLTYDTDIQWNFIDGSCGSDCGALYTINCCGSTANYRLRMKFNNNYIRNTSTEDPTYGLGVGGRQIYLDESSAGVQSLNNVLTGISGECFFNHAGADDPFNGNICDVWNQGDQTLLVNQWATAGVSDSLNNTMQHDIIIMNNNSGGGNGFSAFGVNPAVPTTIQDNLYWNYGSGGAVRTTGDASVVNGTGFDPNPTRSNPQFLTCPGGGVDSWSFKLSPSSPAFNSPVSFPAQGNNDLGIAWGMPGYWGPPVFTIPHTGTPPSYGPTC